MLYKYFFVVLTKSNDLFKLSIALKLKFLPKGGVFVVKKIPNKSKEKVTKKVAPKNKTKKGYNNCSGAHRSELDRFVDNHPWDSVLDRALNRS